MRKSLVRHVWKLCKDQHQWLLESGSPDQLLRELIDRANRESKARKKLIFKIIRCLHCHQGVRAGFIPKVDLDMCIYEHQMEWLKLVKEHCGHASVEKTVRIILDFYRKTSLNQ